MQHTALFRTVAVVGFLSASLWLALFNTSFAESITNYTVELEIENNGDVLVTEIIEYDFGYIQKHGIYRDIPSAHPQPINSWFKERYIDIDLLRVTRNGLPEPYDKRFSDGLLVYVGDADKFVSGKNTYEVKYRVSGALGVYEDDLTALYWNATGNEWGVPIEKVTVSVVSDGDSTLLLTRNCYVGRDGSTKQCDLSVQNSQSSYFETDGLSSYEGISVIQSVVVDADSIYLERIKYEVLAIISVLFVLILFAVYVYRWKYAHRIERTVIPQYEPYENFKPMFTGVLMDNKLDARDITAGIVYLAQQGFISIRETEEKVLFLFESTDYEITLLRSADEVEVPFQRHLIELFFGFAGFEVNDKQGRRTVKLSDVKKSRSVKNAAKIKVLKKDVIEELVKLGFLEQNIKRGVLAGLFAGGAFIFVWILQSLLVIIGVLAAVLIVAAILLPATIAWIFAERRTARGFEAVNHLKGFKDFLSTTEKERYKFHNAPNLNSDQFMEYLPYAIAFGVEEEWAKVFKDISISSPDWYTSSTGSNNFSSVSFGSNLNSFAASLPGTYYSSKSGSGRGGGFGGGFSGGFSGGGGGGGGGGSW